MLPNSEKSGFRGLTRSLRRRCGQVLLILSLVLNVMLVQRNKIQNQPEVDSIMNSQASPFNKPLLRSSLIQPLVLNDNREQKTIPVDPGYSIMEDEKESAQFVEVLTDQIMEHARSGTDPSRVKMLLQ